MIVNFINIDISGHNLTNQSKQITFFVNVAQNMFGGTRIYYLSVV